MQFTFIRCWTLTDCQQQSCLVQSPMQCAFPLRGTVQCNFQMQFSVSSGGLQIPVENGSPALLFPFCFVFFALVGFLFVCFVVCWSCGLSYLFGVHLPWAGPPLCPNQLFLSPVLIRHPPELFHGPPDPCGVLFGESRLSKPPPPAMLCQAGKAGSAGWMVRCGWSTPVNHSCILRRSASKVGVSFCFAVQASPGPRHGDQPSSFFIQFHAQSCPQGLEEEFVRLQQYTCLCL